MKPSEEIKLRSDPETYIDIYLFKFQIIILTAGVSKDLWLI